MIFDVITIWLILIGAEYVSLEYWYGGNTAPSCTGEPTCWE